MPCKNKRLNYTKNNSITYFVATIDFLLLFCVAVEVAVAIADCDAMFWKVLLLLPVFSIVWAADSISAISDGGFVVGLTGFEYLYQYIEMNDFFLCK